MTQTEIQDSSNQEENQQSDSLSDLLQLEAAKTILVCFVVLLGLSYYAYVTRPWIGLLAILGCFNVVSAARTLRSRRQINRLTPAFHQIRNNKQTDNDFHLLTQRAAQTTQFRVALYFYLCCGLGISATVLLVRNWGWGWGIGCGIGMTFMLFGTWNSLHARLRRQLLDFIKIDEENHVSHIIEPATFVNLLFPTKVVSENYSARYAKRLLYLPQIRCALLFLHYRELALLGSFAMLYLIFWASDKAHLSILVDGVYPGALISVIATLYLALGVGIRSQREPYFTGILFRPFEARAGKMMRLGVAPVIGAIGRALIVLDKSYENDPTTELVAKQMKHRPTKLPWYRIDLVCLVSTFQKFHRSVWRKEVLRLLLCADVAVIDVSTITPSTVWEIKRSMRILPPERVLLISSFGDFHELEKFVATLPDYLRRCMSDRVPCRLRYRSVPFGYLLLRWQIYSWAKAVRRGG